MKQHEPILRAEAMMQTWRPLWQDRQHVKISLHRHGDLEILGVYSGEPVEFELSELLEMIDRLRAKLGAPR